MTCAQSSLCQHMKFPKCSLCFFHCCFVFSDNVRLLFRGDPEIKRDNCNAVYTLLILKTLLVKTHSKDVVW